MKGLNYESKLTYSYSISYEQMKRILEIDDFNCFTLKDDLKIVEYSINHSNAIQLSLLLYLQDIQLIRFTIAQQIQLCSHIYEKYLYLKQQNILHNYLSSNRIWLKVRNNQQITILPKNLQYSVHFVGFDCPFYEKDNYQDSKTNDEQTIKCLIISILEQLKKKKLKQKKSKDKYLQLKNIFELLLDEGILQSFEDFQYQVANIFMLYQNTNQRLNDIVDKDLTFYNSKRGRRVDDVIENLQLIVYTNYKNGQFYLLQQILYQTYPKIAKELKDATIYVNQEVPHKITVNNFDKNLFTIDYENLDKIINENKESIMRDFKFEIDMKEITETIKSELLNEFKILNYFQNEVQYQNKNFNQIKEQCKKVKSDIIIKVVRQILNDELILQTLKLIDELI